MPGTRLRIALGVTLFFTAIPLLGLTRIDLGRRSLHSRAALGEAYYLPPPAVLRTLALGYTEFVADVLWVRSIAYFADHLTGDRDFTHLAKHLRNILALDPHFRALYRFGPAILSTVQTNDASLAAIDMLKRGHQAFPDDWQIAFSLGSFYMWELRSQSTDERTAWKRKGAEWIQRASLLGADIPWLPDLAAKVFTEQGQRDLAIRHLEELYLTSQDKKMKKEILVRLRALKADKRASDLRRYAQAIAQRHQKSPLAFVPLDLYALIEVPEPTPFVLPN